jgi:hypothetical protein
MLKFIKNILATLWLIVWALRFAERNDYAPKGKAEGIKAVEGESK